MPKPVFYSTCLVFKKAFVRPLILVTSVHHVSVPRSVANAHNSIRLISKTILLLSMGKTWYMVQAHVAWATGVISYIRVLRQRSYVNMAPFL